MSMTPTETILVVDDCLMNRHLFKATLLSAGYTVAEVSNGEECLKYCSNGAPPALIILDLMMPGMDGFQVLRALRETYSPDQLPVMIVSARDEGGDIVRGLTSGANDYVTKPIERTTFLARVYNHVSLARARRRLDEQREMLMGLLDVQRAISDVTLEAVFVCSADGNIVYRNSLLKELCGGEVVGNAKEVLGKFLPEDLADWLYGFLPIENVDCFEEEFDLPHPYRKNVLVRSHLIHTGAGETLRVWAFHDVTKVREIEAAARLRVQIESVSKFVQGASHMFNNVLSPVLCAANVLRRICPQDRKTDQCLSIIERSVMAGARFTEKISTMVSPRMPLDCAGVEDLGEVLRVMVESAQLNIGDRITFVLETEDELPPVPFNIRNLAEMFGNVLSNAVEAIPGKGVICISAKKDTDEGRVQIRFHDSGLGMDEETAQRVHEPFFSTKPLDIRTGVSCEGRGLGMWNVYNLVHAAGGEVTVSSSVGRGTDVVMVLPSVDNQELEVAH